MSAFFPNPNYSLVPTPPSAAPFRISVPSPCLSDSTGPLASCFHSPPDALSHLSLPPSHICTLNTTTTNTTNTNTNINNITNTSNTIQSYNQPSYPHMQTLSTSFSSSSSSASSSSSTHSYLQVSQPAVNYATHPSQLPQPYSMAPNVSSLSFAFQQQQQQQSQSQSQQQQHSQQVQHQRHDSSSSQSNNTNNTSNTNNASNVNNANNTSNASNTNNDTHSTINNTNTTTTTSNTQFPYINTLSSPKSLKQNHYNSHSTHNNHNPNTNQTSQHSNNPPPNWTEFYKNGPPREVIVLSDEDEDERVVPFQETDQAHLLEVYNNSCSNSKSNNSSNNNDRNNNNNSNYNSIRNRNNNMNRNSTDLQLYRQRLLEVSASQVINLSHQCPNQQGYQNQQSNQSYNQPHNPTYNQAPNQPQAQSYNQTQKITQNQGQSKDLKEKEYDNGDNGNNDDDDDDDVIVTGSAPSSGRTSYATYHNYHNNHNQGHYNQGNYNNQGHHDNQCHHNNLKRKWSAVTSSNNSNHPSYPNHSNHSNYSNYPNHSNHSNYPSNSTYSQNIPISSIPVLNSQIPNFNTQFSSLHTQIPILHSQLPISQPNNSNAHHNQSSSSSISCKPSLTSSSLPLSLSSSSASSSSSSSGRKRRRISEISYHPPQLPIQKCTTLPSYYTREIVDIYPLKTPTRDADGYMNVKLPCKLVNDRFEVTKILGQGTFGKVFSAFDRLQGRYCAVKVIRAIPKYREASKTELRVLLTIKQYDPENVYKCIHVRESFMYRGHMCIVTDLLSMSIYDFLRGNHFLAFPASHVQSFARQLLVSVCFLHDLGLVHTDLKPENILLRDATYRIGGEYVKVCGNGMGGGNVNGSGNNNGNRHNQDRMVQRKYLKNTQISLIDFGSAVFDDEYHHGVVSTRHYRAPEIILGIGWSFPCDMWSVACILVELCIGDALFHTHDNLEHLALMERVLGAPINEYLLNKATQNTTGRALVDKRQLRIDYPNLTTTKPSRKVVEGAKRLDELLMMRNKGMRNQHQHQAQGQNQYQNYNYPNQGQNYQNYPTTQNYQFRNYQTQNQGQIQNQNCPTQPLSEASSASDRYWSLFRDFLSKLFVYDPSKRITAREALRHEWLSCDAVDEF